MIARIRRNWRLSTCIICVSLALMLLYAGSYKAFGQIPPVPLLQTCEATSTVQFGQSNYTLSQGQTANIVVTLNTTSPNPVSVNYATSDGTAIAGVDYVATSGTVTIPAGSLWQVISITTMVDPNGQSSLTFNVSLSSQSGGCMGSPSTATVYLVSSEQACENAPSD